MIIIMSMKDKYLNYIFQNVYNNNHETRLKEDQLFDVNMFILN